MKINVKRVSIFLVSSLIFTGMTFNTAFAVDQAGGKCKKAGQKIKVGANELTCTLIWVSTSTSPKPTTSSSSATKAMQSKSFRLENVTFENGALGGQATARVTNTAKSVKSAFFTITIFEPDGKTVAVSLNSVANSVPAGQTITLTFLGTKELPTGSFKYSFQVDTELNG